MQTKPGTQLEQVACRFTAATILVALAVCALAQEPAKTPPPSSGANPPQPAADREPTKEQRDAWRKQLLRTPKPKSGCFTATYPDPTWNEEPCTPATPHNPYFPKAGGISQLETVGGTGPDFSPTVTGNLTQSEGSFDSVTGVTSTGAYSLQLNTEFFQTNTCNGAPGTNCRGWEQFVYNSAGRAFMQYWLIEYGPPGSVCPMPQSTHCNGTQVWPDGWCPFTLNWNGTPTGFCAANGASEPTVTAQTMSALGQIQLAGAAASGSANDSITVTIGGTPHGANGDNRFPDLANRWQEVEFNVFGDGSGSQATFNSGANLQVRTEVISGTSTGPGCDMRSFTGESSNLTLANAAPTSVAMSSAPALVFAQSNPAPAGPVASCADAVSIGDTHLRTFSGLLYDFQAAGDFTLAKVDPRFEVQVRQVSGAPTWPDATVNKAVAARFGSKQVAICPAPPRNEQAAVVYLNGMPTQVDSGKTLSWPGGGGIRRRGNQYLVFGPEGDSVNTTVNSDGGTTWLDVSVGLGRWPSDVRGLIANVNNNVNQISTRDNIVLTNPFKFDALYHRFADSWRVAASDSLLAACGPGLAVKPGVPSRIFYAKNLNRELQARALNVCNVAGVKAGPLKEACTLDVAVIGRDLAARVFADTKVPVAVATIVGGTGSRWRYLILALAILGVISVAWLYVRKRSAM